MRRGFGQPTTLRSFARASAPVKAAAAPEVGGTFDFGDDARGADDAYGAYDGGDDGYGADGGDDGGAFLFGGALEHHAAADDLDRLLGEGLSFGVDFDAPPNLTTGCL